MASVVTAVTRAQTLATLVNLVDTDRMKLMQRPSSDEYHANYKKYFDLVATGDYADLLRQNSIEVTTFFEGIPPEKLDYKHAEEKWSIKEVLMHMIDTER